MVYQPLQNYGIIGDLYTVALVGMNGSIDFLCFPQFDSPSIFAALLDEQRGGRFKLTPCLRNTEQKQLYFPDSNILLTRFLADEGVSEVSDFMPLNKEGQCSHNLVRRAKTVRGEIKYQMVCEPRFNYARSGHRIEKKKDGEVLFISEGPDRLVLRLRSSVPVKEKDGAAFAEFTLKSGECAPFILEQVIEGEESPSGKWGYSSEAFKETMNYWRNWLGRSTYRGRWRPMVDRSALTLKLLVSQPNGSMVASPTFGLPEEIGGIRNWDYRYTWIRDASFSLYALIRLGYTEEAAAFMKWIEARCNELNPDGSLQIMYGIDGRHILTEETLDHFEGYMHSRPVRIGNNAYKQLQLDIYGELMDAVYLYNKFGDMISFDLWTNLKRLINWLCTNWQRPDEGIWEVRGERCYEFTFSRMMCWVALDRAIRLAFKRSLPAPLEQWLRIRDAIYHDIMEHFWDPKLKAFVQFKRGQSVDASCLLMPLIRFIGPRDPRWLSTLHAIEQHLVYDSLVYRYQHQLSDQFSDGLQGNEGTFCMCSFWYVECLSRAGDLEKARFYFEKMLGYANHLGLYSEELGRRGEHLGNFPQAFTHLALISAAYDLDRRLSAAGQII